MLPSNARKFAQRALVFALTFIAPLGARTSAQTYQFSTVYTFQNNGGPAMPMAVILGSDGLYGVSYYGGTSALGTVFSLTPSSGLQVLHSFTGGDGAGPTSLTSDGRDNLYGSTAEIGYNGTIFELVKSPSGSYTLTTLYSAAFASPQSVTLDSKGNLLGTDDGDRSCLCVFAIPRGKQWTEIYSTGGQPFYPIGNVVEDAAGNLYASIEDLELEGTGYLVKLPQQQPIFPPFGYAPNSLRIDAAGNIYGLEYGGLSGGPSDGMVFKVDPAGNVSTLYTFTGGADGGQPSGPFALDAAGNIFGTATGGTTGNGVIFEITPEGQETVLYNFPVNKGYLYGLVMDGKGNLYGPTAAGGNADSGTIWKLTKLN